MKITNNTTNIKQHKCLQKISEIVDKTQLKKKQFKYVININHEPDDKIKKDLEKSLDKKDVLIKSNNTFKILTDSISTVIYFVNMFDAELKGQFITTIRPKNMYTDFDWYKSLTEIEWVIENEGCKLIKSEIKGETLIIKTVKRVVEEFDTIIELDNLTLIGHSNKGWRDQTSLPENQEENKNKKQSDEQQPQSTSEQIPKQGKRTIIIPPITSSSNDKTFMALDDTAQKVIDASLENVDELTRIENEINTQSINNQEIKTKSEKPIEPPSPYNTPIKQHGETKRLTTEEKLREVNDIFDFTSPNTDAIRKIEFPLSIPSNQWFFSSPIKHIMSFSPTYGTPSKIIDSPSKLLNTPKNKQQDKTNRTNKTPVKPKLGEYGQKSIKTKMDEDIDNFNKEILKQISKSKNPTNTQDQQHNEQSKDQLEDKINQKLQKVDKNLPQIKL
ncbi:hypothetical protein DDB_G0293142 [Dictyostelium discoideum AX4]|uniref:Uncharacterized protein n=1 Tax=Dictyostelium discoideum TaxID=44689 RepID=Q54C99_DICDI|nr:hypothetical protein DDB_G0293142 [Dictyostelium discoideum AX4]EAL60923.1 hypothetical protein DDB_G0293142 [Dictyostelium discoideum AX4]|eukprot:XP_629320.1 hypothetical protein DDB_G0293142 [Dictyostelium discoideum AX4]